MANETWNEWSKVVLNELERLNDGFGKLTSEFQEFKIEVAKEIASKKEVDNLKEEFSQHKLNELQALSDVKEEFNKRVSDLEMKHSNQIIALKTEFKIKAGIWGAAGSLLGVLVAIAIALLAA